MSTVFLRKHCSKSLHWFPSFAPPPVLFWCCFPASTPCAAQRESLTQLTIVLSIVNQFPAETRPGTVNHQSTAHRVGHYTSSRYGNGPGNFSDADVTLRARPHQEETFTCLLLRRSFNYSPRRNKTQWKISPTIIALSCGGN
ncbi:hypothetical protein TNIN_476411 [Trichonephila inaurata madagascariensis]|uniref:Uncharacterized protein n=1 Tax=Trichonephila inaurata madagascariensis TaxID=2747483 RepID=A0A8X6YBA2_9ARAC|nr:hypothetical protein TNIN_476411 [Trichonephila inaurata madagascariensis]